MNKIKNNNIQIYNNNLTFKNYRIKQQLIYKRQIHNCIKIKFNKIFKYKIKILRDKVH